MIAPSVKKLLDENKLPKEAEFEVRRALFNECKWLHAHEAMRMLHHVQSLAPAQILIAGALNKEHPSFVFAELLMLANCLELAQDVFYGEKTEAAFNVLFSKEDSFEKNNSMGFHKWGSDYEPSFDVSDIAGDRYFDAAFFLAFEPNILKWAKESINSETMIFVRCSDTEIEKFECILGRKRNSKLFNTFVFSGKLSRHPLKVK